MWIHAIPFPATELTGPEVALLNSLIRVAETLQAVLPRGVTLQERAERRVPRGFERQVNISGIVYVGGRFLEYITHFLSQPRSASSAAQPASHSSAAQPASAAEESAFDDDSRYDVDRESNSLSNAEQPASDSTAAQFASGIL